MASEQAQVGSLGAITIQGTWNNSTTITLNLFNIDEPGTYPLGVTSANVGGIGVVSNTTGRAWSTPGSGAAGTVTLTTYTASRIAGTFSFNAEPLTGAATGTKVVTGGAFDLILASNGNFGTLPPDEVQKIILDALKSGKIPEKYARALELYSEELGGKINKRK